MARITTLLVMGPVLLVLGVPLVCFAVLTTFLTFWTLLLRAGVVYLELLLALLRGCAIPDKCGDGTAIPALPRQPSMTSSDLNTHRQQKSRSSSVSSETFRRVSARSDSLASLVGTGSNRDYEGVGGWRLSANEDEEALWMNMNSRLELPAAPIHRRHGSYSGCSLRLNVVPGHTGAEAVRSPGQPVAGRGTRGSSRTRSPEKFRASMTALTTASDQAPKASVDERPKSSSSSDASLGILLPTQGLRK